MCSGVRAGKVRRKVKALNRQHAAVDGASYFLLSLFGDRGTYAGSSVGVTDLAVNISVEVEMIVEVADQ